MVAFFVSSDIDECEILPCLNGGTCTHGIDVYYCECAPGIQGDHCQTGMQLCVMYRQIVRRLIDVMQ